MIGAIEAGGTKFVCAVGNEAGEVFERIQIKTETPDITMPKVIQFFKAHPVTALGIGTFGPADVDPLSENYGMITSTPKTAWKNYSLLKALKTHFDIPMAFNTDVNVAALGENTLGAAKGLGTCLYITVGTGIGAGAVQSGELLQGLSHPEMGHIYLRKHPTDHFKGVCPYHGDCLEGLAAGPAIEQRWQEAAANLTHHDEVWEIEAHYLAHALVQFILTLSPHRIVMGGGVMKQQQLFPLIQEKVQLLLNGYIENKIIQKHIDTYIVPPALGDNAGIIGALILGSRIN